jgi:hypothetical protein
MHTFFYIESTFMIYSQKEGTFLSCISSNMYPHECLTSPGTYLWDTEPCIWIYLHPVWFGECFDASPVGFTLTHFPAHA